MYNSNDLSILAVGSKLNNKLNRFLIDDKKTDKTQQGLQSGQLL